MSNEYSITFNFLLYFNVDLSYTLQTLNPKQRQSFTMLNLYKNLIADLWDFIYPPTCLLCDERLDHNDHLCSHCHDRFLDSMNITVQKGKKDFQHLTGKIDFSRVITLWDYTEDLEALIHQIKYERGKRLGRFLGDAAGIALNEHVRDWGDGLMIPVPLHKVRRRERGYNQSELLCEGLNTHLGFEICPEVLIRRRKTSSQTFLSAEERQENVRNAFQVRRPKTVEGRRVILVDDVCTTGATINSCASSLLEAGAREVVGLALARPQF
jgi:ComF family protein